MSSEHVSLPIAARVRRLEERVIAAGLVTDEQLDTILERNLSRATPFNGARLVARAWSSPAFRELLLGEPAQALRETGLDGLLADDEHLRVVANTPTVHNVVVCTLCSCYPVLLLGPSPSWYKSDAYRARVVREPRAVLAEFGTVLPEEVDVRVWDASAEARYMVLPRRPAGTEELDEEGLTALVTRAGLIGTALV
ncbi:nitrile hydratase subunit alpha [Streptomyces rimosus subsp. pseudoverticillatus]|uniref:nitrile hydratase subunit alpha n=1 Tax=Streptomyces rimosus TaxID=1927 RepID=UPI0006B275B3|nr:nitrile hydratase subunit alpha [Streptomyces rimosus]KOT78370.1 nitrile hydratase subunit alpha [Streptomyces rimosus subsp. pseudoverticillatus]